MRKLTALLLTAALLLLCCACGNGGYKLLDVPKELSLDVPALSEDADNLMEVTDSTPLIAAVPEKDVYIYNCDASIAAGVLVKYDGRIQYFPWIFTPQIAEPEAYVSDYNGDGLPDIAFTYCDAASPLKRNENLHILLSDKDKLTDQVLTWQSAAVNVTNLTVVTQNDDENFTVSLLGKTQAFKFDAAGYGAFRGVIADSYQDFTLGDSISVRVKPRLVFAEQSMPVDDVLEYTASVVCGDDGRLVVKDAKITVL